MKKMYLLLLVLLVAKGLLAQKKPLDHSVYDGWQTLAEKLISNDGKFVVYTVTPQEGDATLVIQLTSGKKLFEVARGYNARITEDNKYVVFKIKPTFAQTRTARIARKAPADMPKDSLAIVDITASTIEKIPAVKSYKLPEKASNVLTYLLEKSAADTTKSRVADSARTEATAAAPTPARRGGVRGGAGAANDGEEGTELVVKYLAEGQKKSFMLVNDYVVSRTGNAAVIKTTKKNSDASSKAMVLQLSTDTKHIDTVLKAFNDAKSFAFDDAGKQLAFVAERDSAKKESQKFYKLYYYKAGLDSAKLLADRNTKGLPVKHTISEFAAIDFSESGKRLFIGTSLVLPAKDTSLPEFERAGVDVWNYHDDDLMTVQLKNVEADTRKSYLARYDFDNNSIVPLADDKFPRVQQTLDGDGDVFYSSTDFGKRVARQWQGSTFSDLYSINPMTGERKLILANFKGNVYPSYTGKYLLVYEDKKKAYTMYNSATQKLYAVANDIKYPLYDEDNDVPDDPNPYGIAKWMEGDKYVLIYDHYDVWKVATDGAEKSIPLTFGRYNKIEYRYANLDLESRYIKNNEKIVYKMFDEKTKVSRYSNFFIGIMKSETSQDLEKAGLYPGAANIYNLVKAKEADIFIYTKESFKESPNLFTTYKSDTITVSDYPDLNAEGVMAEIRGRMLSNTNPQQANYNWGTSELFKWKAYTGKETEGVLYKPEDFDPKKKYPMIVYFYERSNETLHNYRSPAPSASSINIPFFVSRGYIVFVPDIWYKTGHPGKSAFDYIVSGTRAVVKAGFVDSTKIGIQGQSWGGYQTAYVITQTNLYAAAWAGAPVVNMFSAYGGIRWESGVTRQFQYEKTQSRIGATIWEKPELYIENSPLFHLPKVKTPLVIMSNDADGAVPWYQGIEYFTAMRRLNKPVWLLVYNNEAHNLVERRNRKDIQVRLQQYFDWLLKGEKPTKWLTEGVPAVMKGRDWGLGN